MSSEIIKMRLDIKNKIKDIISLYKNIYNKKQKIKELKNYIKEYEKKLIIQNID